MLFFTFLRPADHCSETGAFYNCVFSLVRFIFTRQHFLISLVRAHLFVSRDFAHNGHLSRWIDNKAPQTSQNDCFSADLSVITLIIYAKENRTEGGNTPGAAKTSLTS